jgi:hypothetical protein
MHQQQVIDRFLKFTQKRNHFLSHLQQLKFDQLNHPLTTGGWTLLQHMYHLFLIDKKANEYFKHKLENYRDLPDTTFSTKFREWMLITALKMPFKYKAPTLAANLPKIIDLEHITKQWKETDMSFINFVNSIQNENIYLAWFKHPSAGRISLLGYVKFIEAHFDHHKKIIEKFHK